MRLFVCYVPGLDRRRMSVEHTPYIHQLFESYPAVELKTLPTTELVPTLISGVWPHEHGIWQVSLKQEVVETWATRLLSALPDWATTLYQCIHHLFDETYDLAAIPYRRRRHFNLHRFKYLRQDERQLSCGDQGTLFDWLGDRARYQFTSRFREIPEMMERVPGPNYDLDFLEFYAFDLLSHWNLDQPLVIQKYLRIVDQFVMDLHDQCQRQGITMLLLVDHGQEQVTQSIDLKRMLLQAGVPDRDFHYFIEVGVARLWFKTDEAKVLLTKAIENTDHIRAVTSQQLHDWNLRFPDNRFGDLYVIADHGYSFFPHDFYQPLANLYLGLRKRENRPRIFNPRHRANHGQYPDHPAERGSLVLLDEHCVAETEQIELIDVAPTILSLLGREAPGHLAGRAVFQQAVPYGA